MGFERLGFFFEGETIIEKITDLELLLFSELKGVWEMDNFRGRALLGGGGGSEEVSEGVDWGSKGGGGKGRSFIGFTRTFDCLRLRLPGITIASLKRNHEKGSARS